MYETTTSARSTSSRSTSSLSTSDRSRSNGPWKTSRSRSSEATLIVARLDARPDAHGGAGLADRARRDRARPLGAFGERRLEGVGIGPQLRIALADGREQLHDR